MNSRLFKNHIWELYCLRQYMHLTTKRHIGCKCIISSSDNAIPRQGGLVDRLKGILSVYAYTKAVKCQFFIDFSSPFDLQKYLQPNTVDWRLPSEWKKKDFLHFTPLYLIGENGNRLFRQRLKKIPCVYSNFDLIDEINRIYGLQETHMSLFEGLFSPSKLLDEHVDRHATILEVPFIAVHFRFQQLLGDFIDIRGNTLNSEQQNMLTDKCILVLQQLRAQHPALEIVVFSDSQSFLEIAQHNNCRVIPGPVGHLDFTRNEDTYIKMFTDLWAIRKAAHVYSVVLDEMYPSDFPRFAALSADKPFTRIAQSD